MSFFYSTTDAAVSLAQGLRRVAELESQKSQYSYSYPDALVSDLNRESTRVRDAVRFLVSDEAGES